jgi:polyribonucleotide nucleotidyltransferase
VSDYLKEGQHVRVKVLEADEKGRVRLSMKAAAEDEAQKAVTPAAAQAEAPATPAA